MSARSKYLIYSLFFFTIVYSQDKSNRNKLREKATITASGIFLRDTLLEGNVDENTIIDLFGNQDSLKEIYFKSTEFKSINLKAHGGFSPLKLIIEKANSKVPHKSSGGYVALHSYNITTSITDSKIDSISLLKCVISSLNIRDTEFKKINLRNTVVSGNLYISRIKCDTLDIRDFHINNKDRPSVISTLAKNGGKTYLYVDYSTRFENLNIDLSQYEFILDDKCTDCKNKNLITSFFNTNISYFKENGQYANYENLFKYQHWFAVKDTCFINQLIDYYIPDFFYGFGFQKTRVLRSVFILFCMCYLLFLLFDKSVRKAYEFKIRRSDEQSDVYISNRFYRAFVLTAIVFFVFSLNYEKLQFSKRGIIIVMMVFLIGAISCALLANFIFTF